MNKIKEISMKYPDKVPMCVISEDKAISIPKNKFLAPKNYTFSDFACKFREFVSLNKDQALFYLIKNGNNYISPRMSDTLSFLHSVHRSEDGILYVHATIESVFGN